MSVFKRVLKEKDEDHVEELFLIRLPESAAKAVGKKLDKKQSPALRLQMQDNNTAKVQIEEQPTLFGTMVKMPTIIESMKTLDGKYLCKTGDISHMLICSTIPNDPNIVKYPIDKGITSYPHGLTPPLKNVLRKRFRKTARKFEPAKQSALPAHIEKELDRLLQADTKASSVRFESFEATGDSSSEEDENGQDASADRDEAMSVQGSLRDHDEEDLSDLSDEEEDLEASAEPEEMPMSLEPSVGQSRPPPRSLSPLRNTPPRSLSARPGSSSSVPNVASTLHLLPSVPLSSPADPPLEASKPHDDPKETLLISPPPLASPLPLLLDVTPQPLAQPQQEQRLPSPVPLDETPLTTEPSFKVDLPVASSHEPPSAPLAPLDTPAEPIQSEIAPMVEPSVPDQESIEKQRQIDELQDKLSQLRELVEKAANPVLKKKFVERMAPLEEELAKLLS